jgi:4a-hydroxytetrahydrobiopterin dehydratase
MKLNFKNYIFEAVFRKNSEEEKLISNSELNNMRAQLIPNWEMLDHRVLQAKFIAKDHRLAVDFIKFINDKSEELDHFSLIKQDVTEVTVKTTTTDVNGLTLLDFKLAKALDDYAKENDLNQERTKGIFGNEKI